MKLRVTALFLLLATSLLVNWLTINGQPHRGRARMRIRSTTPMTSEDPEPLRPGLIRVDPPSLGEPKAAASEVNTANQTIRVDEGRDSLSKLHVKLPPEMASTSSTVFADVPSEASSDAEALPLQPTKPARPDTEPTERKDASTALAVRSGCGRRLDDESAMILYPATFGIVPAIAQLLNSFAKWLTQPLSQQEVQLITNLAIRLSTAIIVVITMITVVASLGYSVWTIGTACRAKAGKWKRPTTPDLPLVAVNVRSPLSRTQSWQGPEKYTRKDASLNYRRRPTF